MKRVVFVLLMLVGVATLALANPGPPPQDVPEIDASSLLTASALAGSALLMIKRRPRR
jgi:hypothetical protein